MYTFRGNIAEKFGINAAVVAEYLYAGERELEYMELADRTWYRCSLKTMTIDNPYLTVDMAKRAVILLSSALVSVGHRFITSITSTSERINSLRNPKKT